MDLADKDEARDYVIRTFGKDRMDRIFDPSSPIELCQCGSLLEPTDPDECFECRRKKAEVVSVPLWPLVLVTLILVAGSVLLIPLTYSTWRIIAGR